MSSKQTATSPKKSSGSGSGSSSSTKNNANQTTNTNTTTPPNPALKSDYKFLKEAGWENMYYFMLSYGLKIHDDEDYEEGKAILKALRESEQEAWEEEYGKEKGNRGEKGY
ncbi:hypothetical protein DL98DRAFT_532692 [Cadophora sp. DSE1049]|nr:hypothetical protein DL98DRAFT_532692 [Cadophora sp. DSE1049]